MIEVIDNIQINYEKVGQGQPVIVMHGWGQNLEMMYSIVNSLKDDYLIYNIDLPGHGQSDEPTKPYTLDDYEKVLSEFIKINEIKDPIIIGHSFGCRVAIKYASKNDNLKAMVLTGAAGIMPKRNIIYYFKIYTYKFFKLFKDFPFVKHYVREMMEQGGSEDYRNSTPIMKEVLKNTVNEDLKGLLKDIKVPVLLIFGSNDDSTPVWMGEIMVNEIANSELKIYEGASHYAYLEYKEEFNDDVKTFLKEEVK